MSTQTNGVNSAVQVAVRIPKEQRRALRVLAAERETTVQALISDAVQQLLDGAVSVGAAQPAASKRTRSKSESTKSGLGISAKGARTLVSNNAEALDSVNDQVPATKAALSAEQLADLSADPWSLSV
jgi:hypothetical protein